MAHVRFSFQVGALSTYFFMGANPLSPSLAALEEEAYHGGGTVLKSYI